MKTIRIPREIKNILVDEFNDSPNKAIKELLEYKDDLMYSEISGGSINVKIDDDVLEELQGLRLYSTETYGSIILRLLLKHRE